MHLVLSAQPFTWLILLPSLTLGFCKPNGHVRNRTHSKVYFNLTALAHQCLSFEIIEIYGVKIWTKKHNEETFPILKNAYLPV